MPFYAPEILSDWHNAVPDSTIVIQLAGGAIELFKNPECKAFSPQSVPSLPLLIREQKPETNLSANGGKDSPYKHSHCEDQVFIACKSAVHWIKTLSGAKEPF